MFIISRVVIICFVFLLTMPIQIHASAPAEVQTVAEAGLAQFLATIPPTELANMGLTSPQDINVATLGTPYEQFTILPEALADYTPQQTISSIMTSTDNWVYPVLVNGEARTQLNVVKVDGNWTAGYFGGTLPARIQSGLTSGPLSSKDGSIGSTPQLIRIFQVNADFLYFEDDLQEYLFNISSDRTPVRMGHKALGVSEVIPVLNIEVKKAIEAWNKR